MSFLSMDIKENGKIIDCFDQKNKKLSRIPFDPSCGVDFGILELIACIPIHFGAKIRFNSPPKPQFRDCCGSFRFWIPCSDSSIRVRCKDTGQVDKVERIDNKKEIRYEERLPETMNNVKFLTIGACYHLLIFNDPKSQDGTRRCAIVGADPEYPGQYWVWHDGCLP